MFTDVDGERAYSFSLAHRFMYCPGIIYKYSWVSLSKRFILTNCLGSSEVPPPLLLFSLLYYFF